MLNRTNVGIPLVGSRGWLGGVSYIELLVKAVTSLAPESRPRLFLVLTEGTLQNLSLHENIIPLFDGIFFVGNFQGQLPESIRQVDSYQELFKSLDFYFPVLSDVWPGVPAASWIPDFQHFYLPQFFSDAEMQMRTNSFANIARHAQLVLFSSNDALKDFHRFFPQSDAITRVLSFYALPQENWYAGDPTEAQHRYGLPDSFLICCNQFWTHKNHRCLFEAIATLHAQQIDIHLVCTGSTTDYRDSDYFPQLQQVISNLGIAHLVHIVGNIPRNDQIQLIRRSIAVVQPSLFEGWSTVVEDCRTLGKTIILSDLPVHHEQAPIHGVYFDRTSSAALAEVIRKVLPGFSPGPDIARETKARDESYDLAKAFGSCFCSIVQESLLFTFGLYRQVESKPVSAAVFPESSLAHHWLDGLKGLEIGPSAHNPFGLNTRNVGMSDHIYQEEQLRLTGTVAKLHILARADNIPVPDESEDFIISSHVIEHCPDMIKTLVEWYRIVKRGGFMYMIVPLRDAAPSDRGRPLTDWTHILSDFRKGTTELTEPEAGRFGHCHYHVFSLETMKDFIARIFGTRLKLVDLQQHDDKHCNGFTLVYRKDQSNSESLPWDYSPQETKVALAATSEILVSAIVSTYNSEFFMRGCLDDLTSQSLFARGVLEIIVVDSASPQHEEDIVKDFQSRYPNIRYIRTDRRETIYQAWNRGIRAAKGKYITNANTDDRHRPDALEVLAFQLDKHADVALVYADVFVTNLPNQIFGNHICFGYQVRPDFTPEIMLSGCHIGPQPMWRKCIHDEIGYFSEAFRSAGDYEFWCRIAMKHRLLHISQFLGLYFENPDGFCNADTSLSIKETGVIQQAYSGYLPASSLNYTNNLQYRGGFTPGTFVNICMITYNRLEFTRQVMTMLVAHTDFPYVLTVIDNNSQDGSKEYLKDIKKLGIIKNLVLLDENVGVAKASNLAWSLEPEADYYLKLDNDIVVQKSGWLGEMVAVIDALPEVGAVAYNFEPESYPVLEIRGRRVRIKSFGNLGGACIMIPRRTHDLLGFWCEDYGLYGEEDADFGLRISFAGLLNAYMEDEEVGFHLPAGKAAKINDQYVANDGVEENMHAAYRTWKDESRRSNILSGIIETNLKKYAAAGVPTYLGSRFAQQWQQRPVAGVNSLTPPVAAPPLVIGVFSLDSQDSACAQIRLISPITSSCESVSFLWGATSTANANGTFCATNPDVIDAADVIVVQRFYLCQGTLPFIEKLLSSGKPVIYEIDDLITAVPEDNPLKGWVDALCCLLPEVLPRCSAVTVSTPLLAEAFKQYNSSVYVLPNLIDENIWKFVPVTCSNKPIVIGFAGTATHRPDLMAVESALFRIAEYYGNRVAFRFMGDTYEKLTELPGYSYIPFEKDYRLYADTLSSAGFDIALVPLQDNRFNQCKSNIKWLEYSFCGVAGIYSDLPPYNSCISQGTTGLLVDNDPDKWFQAISILIERPELRLEIAKNARAVVVNHYTVRTKAHHYIDTYREIMAAHKTVTKPAHPKFSIIILTWNRAAMLDKCLTSIFSNLSSRDDCEIIVGVNEFNDKTRAVLTKYRIDNLIRRDTNEGLELYKELYAAATGDIIIAIDDDVLEFPNCFDTEMERYFEVFPDYGLIGLDVVQNEHTEGAKPDGRYYGLEFRNGLVIERGPVVGCCMAIRREVFNALGGFSGETLSMARGDDWVLAEKLNKSGMHTGIMKGIRCLHACGPYYATVYGQKALEINKYLAAGLKRCADVHAAFSMEASQSAVYVPPAVSVIIPLYNNKFFTWRCIEEIRRHTRSELYELVLVDNGSTDGTYELFNNLSPPIKVIRNVRNQGFAKACNQGAESAAGKYLLFLNNDTEPQPGWLESLLNSAEQDPSVAAVGSKLLYPDGTIQHAGVVIADDRVTHDPLLGKHIYQGLPADHPAAGISREYKALTAACLLIRREAFEAVQGFDEGYWNGYEDVDLCFKLRQKGWKLIYQPDSVVVHHESKSGSERFAKAAQNIALLHEKWLGTIPPDVIIHPDSREEWVASPASETVTPTPLVSIIIPLFNQAKLTKACIEAIRGTSGDPLRYELILLDNGSGDWTPEYLKTIADSATVITNRINAGFAKGCNRAAKAARGESLLFLNNDTVPQAGWLDALLAAKENDGADIVGAKLLYPDGRVQHAGVAFNKNGIGYHIFKNYPADAPAVSKKRFMQCVTAACMLVSRELFNTLGGFDEKFLNGFEDVDFCLRAGQAGKRILYAPGAVVIHLEEQSEGRKQHDLVNMQRYLARWQGKVRCDDEGLYHAEGFTAEWCPDGTCVIRPRTLHEKTGEAGRYQLIPLVSHSSSSILQKMSSSQRVKSLLKRYTVDE